MKATLLFVIILLISLMVFGRNDTIQRVYFKNSDTTMRNIRFSKKWRDPINYEYTSAAHVALEDDFNNDSNKWTTNSKNAITKIKESKLQIRIKGEEIRGGCTVGDSFNFSRDFELEAWLKIDKLEGKGKSSASIIWGSDTIGQSSRITITRAGRMNITHCKGGDHSKDIHKSFYSLLKKEKYHKFTIRRIADTYYFFVDDLFEKSLPFVPLPGNYLYLAVEPNAEVFFDFIGLYYLN